MSLGGHTQNFAQVSTTAAGFAIEDVKVSGNEQTSEIDILQQLGLDGTTSLVALDIAEARGQVLDGRVSLYNVNFGDASRHFEEAKAPLRRVRERYQKVGKNAAAGSIGAALAQVEEAQRLAGKLDQSANAKANEALEAIRVAVSQ